MADYATQADMEAIYGTDQVLLAADRDADGVVDPTSIASALSKATSEINSYIQARYNLPLSTVTEHLEQICCDIAMFRLSADSHAYTEERRERYKDAVKWLEKVAKGVVTLGVAEDTEDAQDAPTVDAITQTRLFTRAKLTGLF